MSKVIIKAKKSGGLSSEFQNCNDSREVKLEIAPLDIISKQAIGKKEQILLIFKKIVKLNFKNQFHENKNAFKQRGLEEREFFALFTCPKSSPEPIS